MANTVALTGQFRSDRQKGRNNEWEQGNYTDDDELKGEIKEAVKGLVKGESKVNAVKHGIKIGLILRQSASDLRFDGLAFWTVLTLSGIKDIIDIATLSVSGWITVPLLTVPLTIIFFLRKSYFKRWLVRKYIWKYLLISVLEILPATSIFPLYTASAILLKMGVDKKIGKLKSEAGVVDREVSKIQNTRV